MIIYLSQGFVNNEHIEIHTISNKPHRKRYACGAVQQRVLFKFVEMIFQ